MARFAGAALDDLRAQLRALPQELKDEAGGIVLEHAAEATDAIFNAYPEGNGELRDHLSVKTATAGPFGAAAMVINTSKVAYWFENGTQVRHTALGLNRGQLTPAHVFIPRMQDWRRRMYDALAEMVRAHGITVTGEPG